MAKKIKKIKAKNKAEIFKKGSIFGRPKTSGGNLADDDKNSQVRGVAQKNFQTQHKG